MGTHPGTRPPTRERGQALVELTFVLPIVLLMLFGMFDFGRAFVFAVAIQDGARQAARLGAASVTNPTITDTAIRQRLIDASAPALVGCSASISTAQSCGGGTWTLTITPSTRTSGQAIQVKAAGSVALFGGYVSGPEDYRLPELTVQGDAHMVVL